MKLERLTIAQATKAGFDTSDIEGCPIFCLSIPQGELSWDVCNPDSTLNPLNILSIDIRPQYRRQGYATRLLKTLADLAEREGRKVVTGTFTEDGQHLRRLCLRLGFVID